MQRKTLPKKTDNVEVAGESSHDDSEETRLILTEDSTWGLENCPKSYLNTGETRRRNQNDYKYKAPHQRAQIKDINSRHDTTERISNIS